ncbi:helix-turn-helix domain-containing protein [Kribbella sp. NPDC049174]|uniref:AlbA family DNA-binding domain-containing protein n=1 Tax=Kribbella sp. NPDC049174 TaxID=3364112 RepID=UPI0037223275
MRSAESTHSGSRRGPTPARQQMEGRLTGDELLSLIKRGESETLELKSNLRSDDVARQLAAFANSSGGTIVVGVLDDGELVGIPDSRLGIISTRVHAVAEQLSLIGVRLESFVIDGVNILAIHVPKAPDFIAPVLTATGQGFVRTGTEIRPLRRAPHPNPVIAGTISLFVAMSFRFDEEPALVDYYEAIRRATSATGLPIEVSRMDLLDGDYEISTAIEQQIRDSDVVLADFTLNSPNVYYEAGIARGAEKYVIRTARRETELPFDMKTWTTIIYANATQLEEKLADPLRRAYEHVMSSGGGR